MDYIVIVAIGNCFKNLSDHFCRICFIKVLPFDNLVKKFTACDKSADSQMKCHHLLRNNVKSLLILEDLENFQDVWMIEFLQNFNFIKQTLSLRFFKFLFSDDFDSSNFLSNFVYTSSNLSICT